MEAHGEVQSEEQRSSSDEQKQSNATQNPDAPAPIGSANMEAAQLVGEKWFESQQMVPSAKRDYKHV